MVPANIYIFTSLFKHPVNSADLWQGLVKCYSHFIMITVFKNSLFLQMRCSKLHIFSTELNQFGGLTDGIGLGAPGPCFGGGGRAGAAFASAFQ